MGSVRLKGAVLNLLLAGVAILGPFVAYAGVNVIYPGSAHTVALSATPPLTFTTTGTDYTTAQSAGFLGSYTAADNSAAFTMTVTALSGGNVTIDKYLNVTKNTASLTSYKFQVSSALGGGITSPTDLKIRLWAGSTPPTTDNPSTSAGTLCATLSLKSAVNTETSLTCNNSRWIQLIATFPSGSSGSAAVSIRPSSMVFA